MLDMVPQTASFWRRLQAKEYSVSIFFSLPFPYFLMLLLLLQKKLPILGAVLHQTQEEKKKKNG
jgi:hypothetical protein